MALRAVQDREEKLRTWEEVRSFAAKRDESVRWCPCTHGMRVSEDKFIEDEAGDRFYVSNRGWAALCRTLACDLRTVQSIESRGLATRVLNDAWDRNAESMMRRRIVIDGCTVVGVVGRRYQGYLHGRLVEVIDELLDKRGDNSWASVGTAWNEIQASGEIARAIGTELRITLPLSRYEHCTSVEGSGGEGADVSFVGVEARNGLSGECSVSVRALVFRLVCANGMIRTAADYSQRISHTGGQSKLDAEVKKILGTATDGLRSTLAWLQDLGGRVFDAEALVGDRESLRIVGQMLEDLNGGSYWGRRLVKGQNEGCLRRVLEEMAVDMAGPLSGEVWRSPYRSNATCWDFVNIFTEAVQNSGSLEKQLRVEERAGRLAERLANV